MSFFKNYLDNSVIGWLGMDDAIEGFFKGEDASVKEIDTLDPLQRQVFGEFSDYLSGKAGTGLKPFSGDFVAPMSALEKRGIERATEYVDSDLGTVGRQGLGAYSKALEGMSMEDITNFYNTNFRPVQEREFQESVMPQIRESFVGPGTFRSTGRQDAEIRSAERFGESNLAQIGQMAMDERGLKYGLLSQLPSMTALQDESPLRRAEAASAFGALPRTLEQAEMSAMFEEFKRTQPELSPVIDQIMQFMGIQTKASYFDPGKPSMFEQVLPAIGQAAGAAAGAGG